MKIGVGIRRWNVHEFARLKSKVRYVWFQNCAVGADVVLGGDMAFHTQARVSGPNWLTTDAVYPNHHVETGWNFRYWDGRGTTSSPKPMDQTEFFRRARRNQTPATDGSALDFNVVTKPKGPIPK